MTDEDRTPPEIDPATLLMMRRLGDSVVRQAGEMRASQFALTPVSPEATVFLGDSITESGLWNEWFPDRTCRNRGIAGETIEDIQRRLDGALTGSPRLVSVLMGTNDIAGTRASGTADQIGDRADLLLDELRHAAPDTHVVITGVLPRTADLADTIGEVNVRLRQAASRIAAHYLDISDALSDEAGAILPEFSFDSVHLTGAGYRVWVERLREAFSQNRD